MNNVIATMTSFALRSGKHSSNYNQKANRQSRHTDRTAAALANESHNHDDWGSAATTTPCHIDAIISNSNTILKAIINSNTMANTIPIHGRVGDEEG